MSSGGSRGRGCSTVDLGVYPGGGAVAQYVQGWIQGEGLLHSISSGWIQGEGAVAQYVQGWIQGEGL